MTNNNKPTDVAVRDSQELSNTNWTPEQVDLIKNTVAKGATDDELKLFLYTSKRTGLDPLTKQIHFVKRWDSKLQKEVGAIQTGIDGYRAIAERTKTLAGIDDVQYEIGEDKKPIKATVTVYRIVEGLRVGFTASARWTEYVPPEKQRFMWNKMPFLMLGKVAESLALRKAFPSDLSGVYTNEEMSQADNSEIKNVPVNEVKDVVIEPSKEEVTRQEIIKKKNLIISHLRTLGNDVKTGEEVRGKIKALTGLDGSEIANADEIINRLSVIISERKTK